MPFNITGSNRLRRMRDQAIEQAQAQFDPSTLAPQRQEFQRMATEGVGDAGDVARSQAVQQLFSPQQFGTFAGNQGRALAQQQQLTQGRAQQMAGFEGQLAQQDIQMRQQGRSGAAQTQAQQQQIQAQQDAAIEGAELQYQAERDRRRQQLMGTALGIGGAILTTPFGGAGATLGGNLIQSLFGGEDSELDVSQAQGMIDQQQQFSDMMGGIGQLQDGTEQMAGMIDQSQEFTDMGEGIGNIPLPSGYQPLGQQAVAQPQRPSQEQMDMMTNIFGDMGGSRDETVEQMFSAVNVGDVQEMRDYLTTDEGQMETFGIDRQESQQQIQQLVDGDTQQPQTLTFEDIQGLSPREITNTVAISDMIDAVRAGTLTIDEIAQVDEGRAKGVQQRIQLRDFFIPKVDEQRQPQQIDRGFQ